MRFELFSVGVLDIIRIRKAFLTIQSWTLKDLIFLEFF